MADTANVLSFQRLDVYKCSIQVLALSMRLTRSLPKGNAKLADQLPRAPSPSPSALAEAAGRSTDADGARHYAIARGSAIECAAIVAAMQVLGLVDERLHDEAVDLLARIVAMTTKLCR